MLVGAHWSIRVGQGRADMVSCVVVMHRRTCCWLWPNLAVSQPELHIYMVTHQGEWGASAWGLEPPTKANHTGAQRAGGACEHTQ